MLLFGAEKVLIEFEGKKITYENISQKIRLLLYAHPMAFSEISFRITDKKYSKNHGYPSSSIRGRISEMKKRGLVVSTVNKPRLYSLTPTGRKYRENELKNVMLKRKIGEI